ncbi:hypothetical protein, partial [Piscinibacter sakaiensis]|uniref:hypothetical protein n=1 Tax=Piscinibacter sakaiensis TaxID=1547922 RepID=UPI0012FC1A8E
MANTDQKPSVRTVHLVMAGHFESDEAVRAFTRKPAAEAFAKSCAAYDCTHPISPSAEDSNEAWDKYMVRLARWKKRHPAG